MTVHFPCLLVFCCFPLRSGFVTVWAKNEPLCLGLDSQGGHIWTGVHTWGHYSAPSLALETVLGRLSVAERGTLSLCEWYPGDWAQVCPLGLDSNIQKPKKARTSLRFGDLRSQWTLWTVIRFEGVTWPVVLLPNPMDRFFKASPLE